MDKSKTYNTLNNNTKNRKISKRVMPMEFTLTRSLNGVPKTQEQMKSYMFKSDSFGQILNTVTERINKPYSISTNDNEIKSS